MNTILNKLALAASVMLMPTYALSAAFPSKPLTIIVPFAPGGSTDTVARIISKELAAELGQSVVIVNKAGANTIIGTDIAKNSPADGYTMVLATNGHTSNAIMYKKIAYDPIKDFEPVVYLGSTPNVIAASKKSGLESLKQLEDLARTQSDGLFYATAGQGTIQHFTGARLGEVAGVKMTHVAYKGGGPAALDVIAGQVPVLISGLPAAMGYIKAGSLKPLAVTSENRSKVLPDVPTVAESGHAGFESSFWFMMLAPAHTPQDVVSKLNEAFNDVLKLPNVREQLANQGVEATGSTTEQAKQFLVDDLAATRKLVQTAGIPRLD